MKDLDLNRNILNEEKSYEDQGDRVADFGEKIGESRAENPFIDSEEVALAKALSICRGKMR